MKQFTYKGAKITVEQHFNGTTLLSLRIKSGRKRTHTARLDLFDKLSDAGVQDYIYRLIS